MKTAIKANGIHYTPPQLAEFLATVMVEHIANGRRSLEVLDPACGDGALLLAFARAVPESVRSRLILVGYDTNADALHRANRLLTREKVGQIELIEQDFLEAVPDVTKQLTFFDSASRSGPRFDVIISNPPYVRTQVLGSAKAQRLAKQFGLAGRVDLYQAFTRAMASVLKMGGVLGLLTSNRFLTIKSGATLRHLLSTNFDLQAIYDLGDTKLFSAAVLPVVVVGKKSNGEASGQCRFDRVYEHRAKNAVEAQEATSVLAAIRDHAVSGLIRSSSGVFSIERGFLSSRKNDEVWTLTTSDYQDWLAVVREHSASTFDEVAKIRVGIKTTADEVYIRDTWNDLPAHEQPEEELVRPLIRHFDARRWVWSEAHQQTVLYPHVTKDGKRRPVSLPDFPRASRYLESHRDRLTRRHYVIEGGRQWYEIWVPHNPDEWAKPKIVFPDIAEEPKFFLDSTGAIVNGDCYWMTLRPGFTLDHLMLMLAVANSSFATRFYDVLFHNKLYAGRRRFMTQYVKKFPLPDVTSKPAQRAIECAVTLVKSGTADPQLEAEIDELVWRAFGLVKSA
jgi:adenine-specific DNA-methyltransferase